MAEPLVFLPGLMCDARLFGPQIAELSSEMSIMVSPVTRGERIEEIASGLLDELPQRFALAGMSMGGMVAMEVFRRAPERVTRLALMNTSPLSDTPQEASAREPLIVRARAGRLEEVTREVFKPELFAPGPSRGDVQALVMDMADVLGAEVFVRQFRAMQRRRDQQNNLRKCTVPTLILCGAHDPLYAVKRHSFMAELIPDATLQVMEHAGHFPTLEMPVETTQALRDWMRQPLILR